MCKRSICYCVGVRDVTPIPVDSRVLFKIGSEEIEVVHDRYTDTINIRSNGFSGGISVYPEVSNVIRVGIAHRK